MRPGTRVPLRLIEMRRQATEGKRLAAESLDNEARALGEEVEKKLSEARLSAGSERAQMIEQARRKERDLTAKAREETQKASDETRRLMREQADRAKTELRGQVAGLASLAAEKVLGRSASGGN